MCFFALIVHQPPPPPPPLDQLSVLNKISSHAQLAVLEIDKSEIVISATGQLVEALGLDVNIQGKKSEDTLPKEVHEQINWALDGENSEVDIVINKYELRSISIPVPANDGEGVLVVFVPREDSRERITVDLNSELRFKTLFNTANDAIFIMKNYRFMDCNDATLRIFKCTRDQIIGQTPMRFSPKYQPDGSRSNSAAIEKLKAAGEGNRQFFEWQHMQYDGTPFHTEVSLNKLVINGEIYLQAIVRDISARKKAELELLDSHDELLKTNQELDKFVYSASHDLRSPITSLLGLVNVMRVENKNEEFNEYFDLQEKSLKRLDSYIQDIVDYSRNTRLTIDPRPVDFKLIIESTLDNLGFMANMDQIEKIVVVNQKPGFESDPRRLSVIFNNIISNAVKYADINENAPFIRIDVNCKANVAEIIIEDNGDGIPEEGLEHLFEMFYRASAKGVGSGLGLYIVKDAVEKLGGTIDVNSIEGSGAEFVIRVPDLALASLD